MKLIMQLISNDYIVDCLLVVSVVALYEKKITNQVKHRYTVPTVGPK